MKRYLLIITFITIIISTLFSINETRVNEAIEFYERGNYKLAEDLLISAVQNDLSNEDYVTNPQYHYWLGKTYLAQQKYELAYEQLKIFTEYEFGSQSQEIKNMLNIIRKGIYLSSKNNTLHSLGKLGGNINSEYSDFAPVIAENGRMLYFTSARPADLKMNNIWISENVNSYWQESYIAEDLSSDINDSFSSISDDNKTVYVFGNFDDNNNGAIFLRVKENDAWSVPELIEVINTEGIEIQPFLYEDDGLLFFVSDRVGGLGGLDIYVSTMNNGVWSEPLNLGSNINTDRNEQTPFFDGKTLYFASDGHPGLGKLDIFKSNIGDKLDEWSLSENLGIHINSVRNDRYFFKDEYSQKGYLSSDRIGGKGFEDIYFFNLEKKLEEPELMERCKIYGLVTDDSPERNPVQATISFTFELENEKMRSNIVSKEDGSFEILAVKDRLYEYKISMGKYMTTSGAIPVETQDEIEHNILLSELIIEKEIIIDNIYFDFNKTVLLKESFKTLDLLYETFISNPGLKVEISGHTDSIGSNQYNQGLSQRRADAVVEYLVNKGIDTESFITEGYGEKKPIADNATEEGRALNRRVEMKVLENTD
ncbi:MAG: OmpA family protein [Candidatus Tenebribacter burtonii]|jgi:outer membrane protein OmpA-like peptidoglycan-associated protein|nr:OmpA family protein [Candidatus Tenebribacter burtonii]